MLLQYYFTDNMNIIINTTNQRVIYVFTIFNASIFLNLVRKFIIEAFSQLVSEGKQSSVACNTFWLEFYCYEDFKKSQRHLLDQVSYGGLASFIISAVPHLIRAT